MGSTFTPSWRSAPTSFSHCVDFPARSSPSNTINFPRAIAMKFGSGGSSNCGLWPSEALCCCGVCNATWVGEVKCDLTISV